MIDIEKLAKESGARDDTLLNDINDCTYIVFDSTESLTKFAESYCQEKQRQQEPVAKINAQWSCPDSLGKKHRERYVQFKNGIIPREGIELFTYPPDAAKVLEDKEREIAELKSHIEELRKFIYWECDVYLNGQNSEFSKKYRELLDKTPAQILQERENEVIERCAERSDAYAYMSPNFNALSEELRALKVEVK